MKNLIEFTLKDGSRVTYLIMKLLQRVVSINELPNGNGTLTLLGQNGSANEVLETSEKYFDVIVKVYPTFVEKEQPEEENSENEK